jgi:hypothetical protein
MDEKPIDDLTRDSSVVESLQEERRNDAVKGCLRLYSIALME